MYYSDENYKLIPVPKDKQADIHLRVYNGKSFILCKEKQLAFKRQEIYSRLDELERLISKNNNRYSHRDDWSKYNEKYIDEIKELESKLETLTSDGS